MSIIFGGGETPSFTSFNAIEDTTSGKYNSPARCALHISKTGWIKTAPLLDRSDLWLHMDVSIGLITTTLVPITVINAAGVTVFAIQSDGTIAVGSSVIGVASIFSIGISTIDIHIRGGTSGLVEVYVNSQVVFSALGNFSALATMRTLMLSAVGQDSSNDTQTYWSQVIVADETTIGFQLATMGFTGAGTTSSWVGDVANINEVVLDDNTYINAATVGLTSTFVTSDISTSYTNIKAVIVTALARYTSGGPTNIYAVARVGSTDYVQAMNAIGIGYSPALGILHTNPATVSPWTPSDINSAEFGLKSRI